MMVNGPPVEAGFREVPMGRKSMALVSAFLLLGVLSGALFFRTGREAALRTPSPARTGPPAASASPRPDGAAQENAPEQAPHTEAPAEPSVSEHIPQERPRTPAPASEEGAPETEEYTWEDIEAMKNAVKPEDQLAVAALVFLRLSAQDIQYLYSISKDGLTAQEQQSAKELFDERFTPEELAEIYGLFAGYAR